MHVVDPQQASSVPTREQVYAFGAPIHRLSYTVHGARVVHLIAGAAMAVRAFAQRKHYHDIVVGRYLGAPVPVPATPTYRTSGRLTA